MSNLNPLENQECQYNINELYEESGGRYSEIILTQLAKDIYAEDWGYDILLKSITNDINWILKAGEQDYQGDLFYLGKGSDGKYYFLNQGYGSCSGCDAYQSAISYGHDENELNDLREDMKRNIIQFDSLDEFKNYINSDEIKGNHYYQDEDFLDFVNKLNLLFNKEY